MLIYSVAQNFFKLGKIAKTPVLGIEAMFANISRSTNVDSAPFQIFSTQGFSFHDAMHIRLAYHGIELEVSIILSH